MFNKIAHFPNIFKNKPILILDMDETLIHTYYNDNNDTTYNFYIRPGLFNFLNVLKKHYNICIFTAATKSYADSILDYIENNERGKYFIKRFYRDHLSYNTVINNGIEEKCFYKNIYTVINNIQNHLGINKTIIVDDLQQNITFNKNNAINIAPFYDNSNDKALFLLLPVLINFACNKNMDAKTLLDNNMTYLVGTGFFNKIEDNISDIYTFEDILI